jgi:hypothetical protein
MLAVLLEGESLFNDASSIVLFEVFLKRSLVAAGPAPEVIDLAFLKGLAAHIAYLSLAGAGAGLAVGVATRCVALSVAEATVCVEKDDRGRRGTPPADAATRPWWASCGGVVGRAPPLHAQQHAAGLCCLWLQALLEGPAQAPPARHSGGGRAAGGRVRRLPRHR